MVAMCVQPGIGPPQPGERLADRPEIRFCRTSAYCMLMYGEASVPNSSEEDLQYRYWVLDVGEELVLAELLAERSPDFSPDFRVGLGTLSHDAGEDLLLRSAEISDECISCLSRYIRQGRAWG